MSYKNQTPAEYKKAWAAKNKERLKEKWQAYYQENKEKLGKYRQERNLVERYGITPQEYLQLFINQESCCAICSTPQSELKKKLSVDHCHNSSKVRGLLCSNCNTMLGMAEDEINILKAAIKYLEKSREND